MLPNLKPKSEFSRNVLTLMTGTTIAQAIPIAISPILTRIYTPEDFGVFALFVAVGSIVGSLANGRYELAIMLPRKDEDAINIAALGLIISICMTLVFLVLVAFFNEQIAELIGNKEIAFWLYFMPISVFFAGLWNVLNYFNNRRKNYKDISNAIIIKSIIAAMIQLGVGFTRDGAEGLISGHLISQFFANTKLALNITKDKILLSRISKAKMIALAKRYKNFPKFSMWAGLVNILSYHLANILISTFYSVGTLGFYSLVHRVLGIPASLIGASISQVFFQQAMLEKQQTGKVIITFNSTVKKLVIVGLPLFGILFLVVEDLFAFVFGEQWRIAGVYAKILIPFFFVSFISGTVSAILSIFQKLKSELYINISLIVTLTMLMALINDFELFLYAFTAVNSILYLIFLTYYYSLSKGEK